MKNIKDYLHLYLGCYWTDGTKSVLLTNNNMDDSAFSNFKLKLRPLSDITKEEKTELDFIRSAKVDIICVPELGGFSEYVPEVFRWMLSKHFDLFGLIEAGLAIDKTALSEKK